MAFPLGAVQGSKSLPVPLVALPGNVRTVPGRARLGTVGRAARSAQRGATVPELPGLTCQSRRGGPFTPSPGPPVSA
jgi:hypothetical protein